MKPYKMFDYFFYRFWGILVFQIKAQILNQGCWKGGKKIKIYSEHFNQKVQNVQSIRNTRRVFTLFEHSDEVKQTP